MTDDRIPTLQALIVGAHRLTQLAARATGSTVPAATWRALASLEQDGPLRVGELAAVNRITQPGMSRLVTAMLAEGLVTRAADPDDSRASVIRITDAGRAAAEAWRRTLATEVAPRFEGLDDEDWRALARTADLLASRSAEATA